MDSLTQTNPYSSRQLLTKALAARGWQHELVSAGSRHYAVMISPKGLRWMFPITRVWYPFVSEAAAKTSLQKDIAYEYANQLEVRIPATLVLPASEDDTAAFLAANAPVIVKPIAGYGSHGLTLNIVQPEQIPAAVQHALDEGSGALMQEQIVGEEVRFTVVDRRVTSVILRQTPRVVGDGRSTVAQLVAAENKLRQTLRFEYLEYPQLSPSIIPAEILTDQQVLPEGKVLELSKSTMIRGGASAYNITDMVHDSYKQTVLRLARNLSPKFLVVDLMIQDYTKPQAERNYAFMEFNTAPALKLYYSARDGKQYDIVSDLASLIDGTLTADYER